MELEATYISALQPLFSEPPLDLVIRATLAGNSPSRAWAILGDVPTAALLWDGGHCVYLVGDGVSLGGLPSLLARIEAEAAGVSVFKVYASGASWEPAIAQLLPTARLRRRILLRHGPNGMRPDVSIPAGYRVVPIDRALLSDGGVDGIEPMREEIGGMWPSLERFLAHGFGFAALAGGRVVAWCTAEYVSAEMCGIGVETLPEHQRRGIAPAMAAAFLAECWKRGLVAHWDSWRDNVPSLRVAEKLGFERAREYDVYVTETLRPAG